MKKLIVAILVILFSAPVFSRPTGLNVGGGFSMDFVNNVTVAKNFNETYIGPFAEVGYDLKFSPVVGLYFGGRYQLGIKVDYDYEEGVQKVGTTYLSNISLPIFLSFNIPVGKSSLFINVGPTLDYWLSYASVMVTNDYQAPFSYDNKMDNSKYKRFNVYAGGEIGVNIKKHIKVYGAFNQSLINYRKEHGYKRSVGVLRIGAAYVF